MTDAVEVELIDQWHEPGYRIRVPFIPVEMPTYAVRNIDERPDPVTRLRPSDVRTGCYYRLAVDGPDGTPRFRWAEEDWEAPRV